MGTMPDTVRFRPAGVWGVGIGGVGGGVPVVHFRWCSGGVIPSARRPHAPSTCVVMGIQAKRTGPDLRADTAATATAARSRTRVMDTILAWATGKVGGRRAE